MKSIETKLKGCFILQPRIFEDERGYFFESFNQEAFNNVIGDNITFVQDNQSFSYQNVLRGLHFQKGDYAQAKLVRVVQGKVLDVAVDLRKDSETYGEHLSYILDDKKGEQLFIPRGFAHGFVVLSESTVFSYKCDSYYNKESESGIHFADPKLNIDWIIDPKKIIVSGKDQLLSSFKELN